VSEGDDVYYYNTTFNDHGEYEYFIWAVDALGNTDESAVFDFLMPPNWDINNDGVVNIQDVGLLSVHWQDVGSPGWIRADINNDGVVNIQDVGLLSVHWQETWS
ncbi:MAG: dockerin type I domain-containing protein, partial [Candidatus Thermoplasmatota archaeon]|nr:dockerin type I domain-containing protein [Candidatus Thermoplasmatota archaeon]